MKYFPGFCAASCCIRSLAFAKPSTASIQHASLSRSPEKTSNFGSDAIHFSPSGMRLRENLCYILRVTRTHHLPQLSVDRTFCFLDLRFPSNTLRLAWARCRFLESVTSVGLARCTPSYPTGSRRTLE